MIVLPTGLYRDYLTGAALDVATEQGCRIKDLPGAFPRALLAPDEADAP
jgi:hypothetical protein